MHENCLSLSINIKVITFGNLFSMSILVTLYIIKNDSISFQ